MKREGQTTIKQGKGGWEAGRNGIKGRQDWPVKVNLNKTVGKGEKKREKDPEEEMVPHGGKGKRR